MYHYLFTNDLRITNLYSALTKAGQCFVTDTVPSASEDKSENNNMKTLGFYFNLTNTSNCAKECRDGNIRGVVLNFIKKFQFPNPRTQESMNDSVKDGILLAPMRLILQVLYNMKLLYPDQAYLTRNEILNFFFYNSVVAKSEIVNIPELAKQICEYRKTKIFPSSVESNEDMRFWKQEDRQIREMVKLLLYSGCIAENEQQGLYIQHDHLTLENKAALFEILTYTNFWKPDLTKDFGVNRSSYEEYMDVEIFTSESCDARDDDIFSHNLYGIHIKLQNDALSETNPHICIGWSGMGDLSSVTSKEDLSAKYDAAWPNEKSRKKGQDIGQVWRFIGEMNVGDYVVFSAGDICHIGRITSDYYFDNSSNPNQDADYLNNRSVVWLKKDIRKCDLSQAFQNSLGAAMSVFGLNDYKSAVNDLLNGTYKKDEIILEEIEEDILSGFEPWLTSFNNPDFTGKQKYSGYSKALVKLVKYMFDNGLIEDDDLNDKNLDKYCSWIEIYNSSDKAKEYDEKSLSSKAGSAALKKYIKYIKYLITPHVVPFEYSTTKADSINKIFYGVPGCGKSYHIQHKILGSTPYIRTTFYQDYSNTDFVGQILPKVIKGENGEKDTVEYIYNPGPFTLALIEAISNPTEKVALVIEEINRGNAPAIFGDIFQLLDRGDDGISEYGIKNVGMIDYLNDYEFTVDGEKKRYHFDEIKIPGNLDIYATMNTSDQNVYTLDTAFTRRWSKEHIPNEFNGHKIENMYVPGMFSYTWGEFVDAINRQIRDNLESLQVNEDKQVGAFFVKEKDLLGKPEDSTVDKAKMFAYKVLEYLWADVSKLDHHVIFNPKYTTFEDIVKDFAKGVVVFNDKLGFKTASVEPNTEE